MVLTPLHKEDEYIKNKVTGLELKDYVNKIKERAEFYSIPVLDLFSCIGIQPRIEENKKRFTADGLHPNDEGYRRIAEKLEMFLKLL